MSSESVAGGFERYQHEVIEAIKPLAVRSLDLMQGRLPSILFGFPRSDTGGPPRSPRDAFVGKVFFGFSEVSNSYDHLSNIAIYIRRSPPSSLGVSRVSYFRFLVESYLHELYLLKERLVAYAKVLARAYRRDSDCEQITSTLSKLQNFVESTFAESARVRGLHVHRSRYDDPSLERLAVLEFLGESHPMLGNLERATFQEIRAEKRRWIAPPSTGSCFVPDWYFGVLLPIAFPPGQGLRYPSVLGDQ